MIAVVFPGQGSQKPGMGRDLVEAFSEAAEVFDRVSEALHQDLRALCFETDEDTLRQTQNAQLALYTCGVAAYRSLLAKTDAVKAAAGHSVGEYAALAAAGIFSIEQGAKLVQKRGELMAESGVKWPGTMAAVLGLDRDVLEAVCQEAEGVVVIANDNCPGQLVISGEVEGVKNAGELASAKGAKRVLPLNVSGAFHSPLMEVPAQEMRKALDLATFGGANLTVYCNVTAEPVHEPSEWPDILQRQLRNPVRWTESVQAMIRDGATTFVECGGGDVLSGLLKRIDKSATSARVHDAASLAATLEVIHG